MQYTLHNVLNFTVLSFNTGMWATREMSNVENDREMFVRTTIRELVVYCIFLFVLCIRKYTLPYSYLDSNIIEFYV